MKWNTRTKNALIKDGEKYGFLPPEILERGDEIETNYGLEEIILTSEHIKALIDGKALSFDINGGEYAGLIFLTNEKPKPKEKNLDIKVKDFKKILTKALDSGKKAESEDKE